MLVFPSAIKSQPYRPIVKFRQIEKRDRNDINIVFPIPQSVQFTDSAAYNNTELGFTGAMTLNAGRSSSGEAAFRNVVNQGVNAIPRDLRSLVGLMANGMTGGLIPRNIRDAVGIATGTTLNKNITTEFTGVATRQFSFQFKLVPTSSEEARTVKEIVETFRRGLYPEGDSLQLQYPPTWNINFLKDGSDIAHIPKMFETYLTTMSSNYNAGANLFYSDGSPLECELQLTFMETRALTLSDIEKLEKRAFQQGDFNINVTDQNIRELAEQAKENVKELTNIKR